MMRRPTTRPTATGRSAAIPKNILIDNIAVAAVMVACAVLIYSLIEPTTPEALTEAERAHVQNLADGFASLEDRDITLKSDLERAEASYRSWKSFDRAVHASDGAR